MGLKIVSISVNFFQKKFSLRQPLDQIAKFARANTSRPVVFSPLIDGFREQPVKYAQLIETSLDFLQMFLAELHYSVTWRTPVVLQIEDLFCFFQRQTNRLRFLNELHTTDRFRRIESIIRCGTLWFWQQSEPLVLMQCLHTDSGGLGNRADLQQIIIVTQHRELKLKMTVGQN